MPKAGRRPEGRSKAPEIGQTSPSGERDNQKKYSAGASPRKGQPEVGDNPINHREVAREGHALHRAPALRVAQRVNFRNLANHLGPALERDAPELLLGHPERKSRKARFLEVRPASSGVHAEVPDHPLAIIRDMGGLLGH